MLLKRPSCVGVGAHMRALCRSPPLPICISMCVSVAVLGIRLWVCVCTNICSVLSCPKEHMCACLLACVRIRLRAHLSCVCMGVRTAMCVRTTMLWYTNRHACRIGRHVSSRRHVSPCALPPLSSHCSTVPRSHSRWRGMRDAACYCLFCVLVTTTSAACRCWRHAAR